MKTLLTPPSGTTFFKTPAYDSILVLAPHCDDEAIGCGGTILKYQEMGCKTLILYLTSEQGEKKDIRRKEALSAWAGFSNIDQVFLDFPDGQLYACRHAAARKIREWVEQHRPEMILLPWPFDIHPDHQAVFPILAEALVGTALCDLFFYEIFYPLISNHLENISGVFQKKIDILKAFQSQLRLNFLTTSTLLNQYRAACLAIKSFQYAEAFFILRSDRMKEFDQHLSIGYWIESQFQPADQGGSV